jgi:WD40 repeat protein
MRWHLSRIVAILLTGSNDGIARLWEVQTGKLLQLLQNTLKVMRGGV